MRFDVHVEWADANHWKVEVRPEKQAALEARTIRRLAGGEVHGAFPLPPEEEVARMLQKVNGQDGPFAECANLCASGDAAPLYKSFVDSRKPLEGSPGVRKAFGRYLFATLLGEATWKKIEELAGGDLIDLVLHLPGGKPSDERDLYRLPWEMMHGPGEYLAQQLRPSVALSRAVANSAWSAKEGTVTVTPRVLFVISRLNDPEVRAGSEFVGLLQQLDYKGLTFHWRVLLGATTVSLHDAVTSFNPSIVHFICHGGFENDQGYLDLMKLKDPETTEHCGIDSLYPNLKDGQGRLPPVVVLNACWSGAAPPFFALPATPLAVRLVEKGVPVVVGMAGKVADDACRLFTRSFYEALLEGTAITDAAARGRRAALTHWGGIFPGPDWAFPTIFQAEGVPASVTMSDRERLTKLQEIATGYRKRIQPKAFCGRLDLLENAYYELMTPKGKKSVLAVGIAEPDQNDDDPRYGKTRLLEQVAAKAVRDGHVPCLVTFEKGDKIPATVLDIACELVRAMHTTEGRFEMTPPADYEVLKLNDVARGGPSIAALHADVQNEMRTQRVTGESLSTNGPVVAKALELDLAKFVTNAPSSPYLRGTAAPPTVLLLVDDVHRFGLAAHAFCDVLLHTDHLTRHDGLVRVIFTFSEKARDEYKEGKNAVFTFVGRTAPDYAFPGTPPDRVIAVQIHKFAAPAVDPLPYRQFLIQYTPPYVVRDGEAKRSDVEKFYVALHRAVQGAPTSLTSSDTGQTIFIYRQFEVLAEASDAELMKALANPPASGARVGAN